MRRFKLYPSRLAAGAVEVLIDVIEGRPPERRERLTPTNLVVRDSTRPPTGAITPDA
jgi:DNA-binding LacI/PurR family transcriptional regulator